MKSSENLSGKRPRVGDLAPDFTLAGAKTANFQLKKQLEVGPLVLFFYPKDFTSGCTAESCSFRDFHAEFARKGAAVFGVSRDDIPTHLRFIEGHSLPYDLLSDPDQRVHSLYGVKKRFGFLMDRVTFVIDRSGVIRQVFDSKVDMGGHIRAALQILQT